MAQAIAFIIRHHYIMGVISSWIFVFALQYPESTLEVETKQVMMTNVSSLPLSVVLKVTYPFQLLVEDPRWAPVNVKSSQSVSHVNLRFLTEISQIEEQSPLPPGVYLVHVTQWYL